MRRGWLLLALPLLAACVKEPTSYLISGSEVAITLERIKPYFWSRGWQLDVVLRHDPACQRRHELKPTSSEKLKVEVYTPQRGVFILRQGKRWYVAELRTCGFQPFAEDPPEPGDYVGAFRELKGEWKFVSAGKAGADKDNGE
jgi:hypothetical protein